MPGLTIGKFICIMGGRMQFAPTITGYNHVFYRPIEITVSNFTINVHLDNEIIVVKLSHSYPQSVPLNNLFPAPNFFTTDNDLNDTPCKLISSTFVVNQLGSLHNVLCKNDIVEFKFQTNYQPYFLFNEFRSKIRIYVIL